MDQMIGLLRKCEIFSGLDDHILELLAPVVSHRTCDAGKVLFAASKQRESFFLILEGQVEVRVESGDAAGTILILGRGDGTGEAGL
ncbi:MAG: cyclic nucleotide-binding domain-containing protein, partial [Thermoanaerobaculales bacterium]|nr:cyclic nucleotide-binding domain-containing protein [Thermoanaerobaculales bacterium]